MGVRIVTDSSSDLSPGLVDELSVEVVPLKVRFGDEELVDGTELSAESFWARLRGSDAVVQTTAPSPGDFEQAFTKVASEGASAIVCLTLSSKVSATHQAACLAAEGFSGRCPVAVVDSLSVSAGLGNLCLVAARRAAEGADASTVVREVEELRGTFGFYGAVETLEYLRRGGRIGAARALLGTALSIRPLLSFEHGVVEVAGKVRTRQRALAWIAERLEADLPVESVTAFHADAPDVGAFVELLAAKVPAQKVELTLMGPVMGTHLGPGTVGVTYFKAAKERA
jgi:DegV family protein with EDD domain